MESRMNYNNKGQQTNEATSLHSAMMLSSVQQHNWLSKQKPVPKKHDDDKRPSTAVNARPSTSTLSESMDQLRASLETRMDQQDNLAREHSHQLTSLQQQLQQMMQVQQQQLQMLQTLLQQQQQPSSSKPTPTRAQQQQEEEERPKAVNRRSMLQKTQSLNAANLERSINMNSLNVRVSRHERIEMVRRGKSLRDLMAGDASVSSPVPSVAAATTNDDSTQFTTDEETSALRGAAADLPQPTHKTPIRTSSQESYLSAETSSTCYYDTNDKDGTPSQGAMQPRANNESEEEEEEDDFDPCPSILPAPKKRPSKSKNLTSFFERCETHALIKAHRNRMPSTLLELDEEDEMSQIQRLAESLSVFEEESVRNHDQNEDDDDEEEEEEELEEEEKEDDDESDFEDCSSFAGEEEEDIKSPDQADNNDNHSGNMDQDESLRLENVQREDTDPPFLRAYADKSEANTSKPTNVHRPIPDPTAIDWSKPMAKTDAEKKDEPDKRHAKRFQNRRGMLRKSCSMNAASFGLSSCSSRRNIFQDQVGGAVTDASGEKQQRHRNHSSMNDMNNNQNNDLDDSDDKQQVISFAFRLRNAPQRERSHSFDNDSLSACSSSVSRLEESLNSLVANEEEMGASSRTTGSTRNSLHDSINLGLSSSNMFPVRPKRVSQRCVSLSALDFISTLSGSPDSKKTGGNGDGPHPAENGLEKWKPVTVSRLDNLTDCPSCHNRNKRSVFGGSSRKCKNDHSPCRQSNKGARSTSPKRSSDPTKSPTSPKRSSGQKSPRAEIRLISTSESDSESEVDFDTMSGQQNPTNLSQSYGCNAPMKRRGTAELLEAMLATTVSAKENTARIRAAKPKHPSLSAKRSHGHAKHENTSGILGIAPGDSSSSCQLDGSEVSLRQSQIHLDESAQTGTSRSENASATRRKPSRNKSADSYIRGSRVRRIDNAAQLVGLSIGLSRQTQS